MRSFIALLAAAFIGLAFASTEASARPMGGGFRHGGFRGFGPLVGVGVGLGLAASYPYWGYPAYDDGCLAPRRIWTPYGWRVRWVNVCY